MVGNKINSTKKIKNKIIESKSSHKLMIQINPQKENLPVSIDNIWKLNEKFKFHNTSKELYSLIITKRNDQDLHKKIWSILTKYQGKKTNYEHIKWNQSKYHHEIINDIDRTPFKATENISKSKDDLVEVLNKYSLYNPKVGYVQGMNYLAASLYSYFRSKHDVFWVLHSIMTEYNLEELYDHGLERLK